MAVSVLLVDLIFVHQVLLPLHTQSYAAAETKREIRVGFDVISKDLNIHQCRACSWSVVLCDCLNDLRLTLVFKAVWELRYLIDIFCQTLFESRSSEVLCPCL